ncbi:MAG: hypothetical protein EAY75_14305 [Bacteroidetes bacterium]|nr:MAG: hypothetical protein EAY75_14305 [Bacteroidota bacterium]
MKSIFFLLLCFTSELLYAQVDTVVVQYDSTFTSLFSRRLNDKRTAIIYTMEDRGDVRDVNVYLSTLEEIVSGRKMYAVRIDARLNRNLFTDAPVANAEYIDEDELPLFIERLEFLLSKVMNTNPNNLRYTEYRFYTRSGIALECYTGLSRWRVALIYEIDKRSIFTYINNEAQVRDLLEVLKATHKEILLRRGNKY